MKMHDEDTDPHARIAKAIKYAANVLGTNDATPPMGAIEMLALESKEGSERIAGALSEIASALGDIALALRERE
jgi:hypothetical protein